MINIHCILSANYKLDFSLVSTLSLYDNTCNLITGQEGDLNLSPHFHRVYFLFDY